MLKRNCNTIESLDHIKTKEKIMLETARLFAIRGYGAVSIRDIAKAVGVQPAAIYNHFAGKKELFEALLDQFQKEYREYFRALDRAAESFGQNLTAEGAVDILFEELFEVTNKYIYYCIAILIKEQFHFESAREMYYRLFQKESIENIQRHFDRVVERGLAAPCDTKALASILMYSVMAGNMLRLHELMGCRQSIVDCGEMYQGVRSHILASLKTAG